MFPLPDRRARNNALTRIEGLLCERQVSVSWTLDLSQSVQGNRDFGQSNSQPLLHEELA